MTDETRNGWQSEWGDLKCARLSGRVCVRARSIGGQNWGLIHLAARYDCHSKLLVNWIQLYTRMGLSKLSL